MRIAMAVHGLSNGGAERVAALVANHYAHVGHEVLFLAVYSPEKVYPLDPAVEYRYVGGAAQSKIKRKCQRSWNVCQAVREFRADVVVSFIIDEVILCAVEKVAPIVYSLRFDPNRGFNALSKTMAVFSYSRAKRVIFQTPGARDFFPMKIREKGVMIPNPLTRDLPRWDAEHCEKTVITACRLDEGKNIPMLISGFARFAQSHPEWSCKVYGEGDLLEELKAYAQSCGVADRVFFPGYAKNIHEIMANANIFALTSDYEGLSNSMLEALMIGVPTVCTDCSPGGAALYIRDGVNGMLVPVGDSEALSQKLCEIADDPELQRSLSKNTEKIREELDVDRILKYWEEAIQ